MAGEWVKMRGNLRRDRKTVAMARFLCSSRYFMNYCGDPLRVTAKDNVTEIVTFENVTRVTVAGLLEIWASLNESINKDGICHSMTLTDIDDIVGIPDFGEAMEYVGWVEQMDAETLMFPNFTENNTPAKSRGPAMTNAERQKKYRAKKKAEKDSNESNVTLHREEKRKEEKSTLLTEGTPQTPLGDCADSSPFGNGIGSGMAALGATIAGIRSLQESWSGMLSGREMHALERELKLFENYPFEQVRDWMRSGPDKPKTNRYDFIESGGVSEKGRALEWAKESKKVAAPTAF